MFVIPLHLHYNTTEKLSLIEPSQTWSQDSNLLQQIIAWTESMNDNANNSGVEKILKNAQSGNLFQYIK